MEAEAKNKETAATDSIASIACHQAVLFDTVPQCLLILLFSSTERYD